MAYNISKSTGEDIATLMHLKYGINPNMILYQVSVLLGLRVETKIIERNDEEYGWIINSSKYTSYELKYLREYNGMTDVVIYSKVGETRGAMISCYTLENEEVYKVCTLKDFIWKNNNSMVNFIIPMFVAFREQGIIFTNNAINEITDKFIKERRKPKTLERTKNNKEGNR